MAQKNLFRDILRLITPEEVAVLTDTVMGRQKIMLKLIVQEDLGLIPPSAIAEPSSVPEVEKVEIPAEIDDGKAKILPFVKEDSPSEVQATLPENEEKKEDAPEPPLSSESATENYVEINEDGSVKFKEEEVVFEEKVDMTEFILSQQEKCKEVSFEMKKKEVMALYNKNATVDLSRERAQRSDPSRKYNDGVLINKKQG